MGIFVVRLGPGRFTTGSLQTLGRSAVWDASTASQERPLVAGIVRRFHKGG